MLWENVRGYKSIVIEKEKGPGGNIWEVIYDNPFSKVWSEFKLSCDARVF